MIRARAVPSARWALRTAAHRRILASLWGVSPTRASHRTTDGRNALADVLALIRHPDINPAPLVTATLEALEDRYVDEARCDRRKLEERLDHLLHEAEHKAQAAQDRALMTGRGVNDACRHHAAILLEIIAIRNALGMEDDS